MVRKAPVALVVAGLLGVITIGALVGLLIPPITPKSLVVLVLLSCGITLAVWWGMRTAGRTDTPYW